MIVFGKSIERRSIANPTCVLPEMRNKRRRFEKDEVDPLCTKLLVNLYTKGDLKNFKLLWALVEKGCFGKPAHVASSMVPLLHVGIAEGELGDTTENLINYLVNNIV